MPRVPLGATLALIFTIFFGSFIGTLLITVALERQAPAHATSSPPVATDTGSSIPTETPPATTPQNPSTTLPSTRAHGTFIFSFNTPGVLNEAPREAKSTSPFWFLDSGGRLIIENSIGKTIQGALPVGDRWRNAYARTSAVDTDDGAHPQNLFRLVTTESWGDTTTELSYYIVRDNLSASPNRNESNGLLLMSRYQDHDTLYYAGIRVDGTAVIKKKYRGVYYTMAQTPLFTGVYDRSKNPNLLPKNEWLGLRVETRTSADGSVSLTLFFKRETDTAWTRVLFATDDGVRYGGTPPIATPGALGVRTDFMDAEFSNFRVEAL